MHTILCGERSYLQCNTLAGTLCMSIRVYTCVKKPV